MILTYKNLEMYPVQNYVLTELYLEYRSENTGILPAVQSNLMYLHVYMYFLNNALHNSKSNSCVQIF